MNEESDVLRPLSFDKDQADETQPARPLSSDKDQADETQPTIDEKNFVPLIPGTIDDIRHQDSNFVFFFGVSDAGKTVILSAILYYLATQEGSFGVKDGTENTKEALALFEDLYSYLKRGRFPARTTKDKVTRLDLVFTPNNKSIKVGPINLTFLETAGGNHQEVRKGGKYHGSIDAYLNASIPLYIIIVARFDTAANDDILIDSFFRLLQSKPNLKLYNVLLVISQWDKSGDNNAPDDNDVDSFVKTKLPLTNKRFDTFQFPVTYFSIGTVEEHVVINEKTNKKEKIDIINPVDLTSAKKLSYWLYQSIVKVPLNYPGTFWERIKFSLRR